MHVFLFLVAAIAVNHVCEGNETGMPIHHTTLEGKVNSYTLFIVCSSMTYHFESGLEWTYQGQVNSADPEFQT